MAPTNYFNAEKIIVEEKSQGGAEFREKTSSTEELETVGDGFDGLSEYECKALEKRCK